MTELAAIKTVEWALEHEPSGGFEWCTACEGTLTEPNPGEPPSGHGDSCPIPALGAAILKEHHWWEKTWIWPTCSRQKDGAYCKFESGHIGTHNNGQALWGPYI